MDDEQALSAAMSTVCPVCGGPFNITVLSELQLSSTKHIFHESGSKTADLVRIYFVEIRAFCDRHRYTFFADRKHHVVETNLNGVRSFRLYGATPGH
jgi:hypothetical protein